MHEVIQRVTADNEVLRHDMQRVEGALADILAATDMEMQSETVDENISDLRHLLTKQRKSIEDLKVGGGFTDDDVLPTSVISLTHSNLFAPI